MEESPITFRSRRHAAIWLASSILTPIAGAVFAVQLATSSLNLLSVAAMFTIVVSSILQLVIMPPVPRSPKGGRLLMTAAGDAFGLNGSLIWTALLAINSAVAIAIIVALFIRPT